MKRRTFLSLCAITPTAGCADLAPGGRLFGSSGTRIKSLRATNYRSTAQTFHARLSDGAETTYERTIEVPGLSDGIPGGREFSEVPADPQTGQLTAYINDQPEPEWKHLSFDDIEADCVNVKLIISHIDNEFGIWYAVDCNDPSNPQQWGYDHLLLNRTHSSNDERFRTISSKNCSANYREGPRGGGRTPAAVQLAATEARPSGPVGVGPYPPRTVA